MYSIHFVLVCVFKLFGILPFGPKLTFFFHPFYGYTRNTTKGNSGIEIYGLLVNIFFSKRPISIYHGILYMFYVTLSIPTYQLTTCINRLFFGYFFHDVFLLQDESSVQQLIDACIQDDDKLYLCVSSPTIKDKPVQIRPWRLSDADFVLDASMPLDPRKTVFVGGVPRPLKAGKF